MEASAELSSLVSGSSRVILISERDVDLRPGSGDNRLFLLKMAEGSLAAGGRGGGFGERRDVGVFLFALTEGAWSKLFETREAARLSDFEVPYYVSRLPMTLADGTETMGYGVVDPDLVGQMLAKANVTSSA
jgi:hypothetical protein